MLCKTMRWTYQEYASQPGWFLDMMEMMHETEAEHQRKEAKKIKEQRR